MRPRHVTKHVTRHVRQHQREGRETSKRVTEYCLEAKKSEDNGWPA